MAGLADSSFEQIRQRLRSAVREIPVDPALRVRVSNSIESVAPSDRWPARLTWSVAALLLFAALFTWESHRFDYAWQHHLACALRGEVMVRPLGETPLRSALPAGYGAREFHVCRMGGRELIHAVLEGDRQTISVVLAPIDFPAFPPSRTVQFGSGFEQATLRAGENWLHVVGEHGSEGVARQVLEKLGAETHFSHERPKFSLAAQSLQLRIFPQP